MENDLKASIKKSLKHMTDHFLREQADPCTNDMGTFLKENDREGFKFYCEAIEANQRFCRYLRSRGL